MFFFQFVIQAGMFFVVPLFLSVALGLRFVSDADLERALDDAGIEGEQAQAIVDENEEARIQGLRASLAVLAIAALIALFLTRLIPVEPVGGSSTGREPAGDAASA
jgi:hypothetical protein